MTFRGVQRLKDAGNAQPTYETRQRLTLTTPPAGWFTARSKLVPFQTDIAPRIYTDFVAKIYFYFSLLHDPNFFGVTLPPSSPAFLLFNCLSLQLPPSLMMMCYVVYVWYHFSLDEYK